MADLLVDGEVVHIASAITARRTIAARKLCSCGRYGEDSDTMDQREFRNCLGAFPTGVTVITALGPRGEAVGNTVSSFNSVSLDPPLVLWSLGRHAHSLKAYLSTDQFAVNVLREGQETLSARFAKALGDKWAGIDYETWETGCPILSDALAVFECRTAHTYVGGDHVIFVGEVINAVHDPDGRPLVHYRGSYAGIASQG